MLVDRRADDDHHEPRLGGQRRVVGHLERPADHLLQDRLAAVLEERHPPRPHRFDGAVVDIVNR